MKELFSFEERIGRPQWWVAVGSAQIVTFAALYIWLLSSLPGNVNDDMVVQSDGQVIASALVPLAIFIPAAWVAITANAKRYHDRGKSGWTQLIALIPIASIWILIELGFLPGTDDEG